MKLWDTETGACISRFTSRKIPYCAKFNPDPDKQHLFVAGTSDKKIICVSRTIIHVVVLLQTNKQTKNNNNNFITVPNYSGIYDLAR